MNIFDWKHGAQEATAENSEEIPDYLLGSLLTWINDAEIFVSYDRDEFNNFGDLRMGKNERMLNLQTYERRMRRVCPYSDEENTAKYFSGHGVSDDEVYEFVNFLCSRIYEENQRRNGYWGPSENPYATFQQNEFLHDTGQKILDNLETILMEGGSSYRLEKTRQQCRLEKRVDPVMQESTDRLFGSEENTPEMRHLQKAWDRTFGRDPDYQYAYAEVVRAVEAVICPLVEPNNGKSTLSSVANVMRSQPGWHYTIEPKDEHAQVPGGFMRLAVEAIMNNHQQRHESGGDSASVTERQTKGALYMAVSIVQAAHDGLITRDRNKESSR